MYTPSSPHAHEFLDNAEIAESIAFAQAHSTDRPLLRSILAKAAECRGLSHREALVLLECALPEENAAAFALARDIKRKFYGNRIVLFAPLYLSNHCVNGCLYCPYHLQNKHIPRKKLSQEEIRQEAIALQSMGHKRLAIETGEHPVQNPIEYILESIRTLYSTFHERGAIRRVNVNIAATTVENYRRLKEAGIGTYILFQETYHRAAYERLHPSGPKHDYAYHAEAMDRAMQGGIDDVGLGALFGLDLYRTEFAGLLMHAEHLEARFGVGPHTLSVPRIRPADDVHLADYSNAISDDVFEKIVAVLRIAVPYTGIIVSTRESVAARERVLKVGVTQLSGGSRTSVGGYAKDSVSSDLDTSQFEVSDTRTLDEVVRWLLRQDHIPSFCTACYRQGRTGDRFMQLVKSGQIADCCQPNALMTLKEYLEDYATPETRTLGEAAIERELAHIATPSVRDATQRYLDAIRHGERDFRI